MFCKLLVVMVAAYSGSGVAATGTDDDADMILVLGAVYEMIGSRIVYM